MAHAVLSSAPISLPLGGGLSLRLRRAPHILGHEAYFPSFFGRAFIEADLASLGLPRGTPFPFLFGGAFIEATDTTHPLRPSWISLPFWEGFH